MQLLHVASGCLPQLHAGLDLWGSCAAANFGVEGKKVSRDLWSGDKPISLTVFKDGTYYKTVDSYCEKDPNGRGN